MSHTGQYPVLKTIGQLRKNTPVNPAPEDK